MNPTILVDLIEASSKIILEKDGDAAIITLKKRVKNIELINQDGDETNVFYGEINHDALAKLKSFDDLTVIYRDVTPETNPTT